MADKASTAVQSNEIQQNLATDGIAPMDRPGVLARFF